MKAALTATAPARDGEVRGNASTIRRAQRAATAEAHGGGSIEQSCWLQGGLAPTLDAGQAQATVVLKSAGTANDPCVIYAFGLEVAKTQPQSPAGLGLTVRAAALRPRPQTWRSIDLP